ncbi:COP9 signalosome complex subunit 7a [Lachnellula subtilissima]|uniref:COP9 signalosome complex subunit 7a n=1 Tax=Lachnellula subtilissima TaxID=602034 RepID=A0A8H8RSQ9_9HELO|nr:COP9 signalosome complex subunit 7a [Lachnellula subtilissima]
MEQTKALNALEPFLALTKSASSPRAAADLVQRATSAPNTYIFAELLSSPQIQSLSSSPDHAAFLTLLQIFSYGTYKTYISTPNLPPLNTAQTLKLRQLSFLTLARRPEELSYTNLIAELGLDGPRELEDVVISAIYAGLIQATLDPYNSLISISSVAPLRDLTPSSTPSMLLTLSAWSSRCSTSLSDLEAQIAQIKTEAKRRQKEEAEWNKEVEKLVESGGGGGGGGGKGAKSDETGGGGGFFGGLGKKLGGSRRDDEDVDMEGDGDGEKGGKNLKRSFGLLASGL